MSGLDSIQQYIDPQIAIILWGVGSYIKYSKLLSKVNNDVIPIIIVACGILLVCLNYGFTMDSIIKGIITAIFSIGSHATSKESLNYLEEITNTSNDESNEDTEDEQH